MNYHLKNFALAIAFILLTTTKQNANARTRIFNISFGTQTAINPAGWIFTGANLNISLNNPSSGYSGASGFANLSEGGQGPFTNTFGTVMPGVQLGTSTATMFISTLNYSNIRVSFGMRKSSSDVKKNITASLEWSTDGLSYFPIDYRVSSSGNWSLATGTGLVLPSAAENQPILFLRWTFIRTGLLTNIKIDDFKARGDSICSPVSILLNPVDVLPVCPNSETVTYAVTAAGSGLVSYQWQRDSINIADDSLYTGTNLPSLSITNPPYSFNGYLYRCIVTNCSGGYTAISNETELKVKTLKTDINKDGNVDNNDFIIFLQNYNTTCTGCPEDIISDGIINVLDFLMLLSEYDRTCQ